MEDIIVPLVDLTSAPLPVDDENADASDVSLPIQAILAVLNGHIDTTNIEAGGLAWTVMASLVDTAQLIDGAVTAAKIETQEDWNSIGAVDKPAFENSWVNLSTVSYGYAGYMKDSLGFVHLRGSVKNGTATVGLALFTLPAGYRPSSAINVPVMAGAADASNYGALQIGIDGKILYLAGGNTGLSLSGITFKVA